MQARWISAVTNGMVVLLLGGCIPPADGSSEGNDSSAATLQAANPAPDMAAILAAQGLTIIDHITCSDPQSGKAYTGYLAVFDGHFSEGTNAAGQHIGPLPKTCLVLTGSPYCMGYQMGYLRAQDVQRLCTTFLLRVAESLLKISYDDFPEVLEFLKHEVNTLCEGARSAIPDYLEEEMAGVAAGATARGYAVNADEVMLINEGFDGLYAILSTGVLPSFQAFVDLVTGRRVQLIAQGRAVKLKRLDETIRISAGRVLFPKAAPFIMGCNEFVVSGAATGCNAVYHGRDFMFPTGDIYQDFVGLIVYLPSEGLPFLAVSAPGFVGHPTGLNSRGLSMGMDVVRAACARPTPGMGSLFVLRDVVQHCGTLDEAVARMQTIDRGVSWIYAMATDGRSATYTNGVVVESGRSDPPFTGPDIMPIWDQILLWPLIARLTNQPQPERGILVRSQAWVYPDAFKGVSIGVPNDKKDDINYLLYFPDQNETWPDVVVAANHYVIPRMVFSTFHPLIDLMGGSINKASLTWRYDKMIELIGQDYSHIDHATARAIIDFLNPNRGIDVLKRYQIGGPVAGHHALIDNRARTVEALFGYYGNWDSGLADSWVSLDLKPFAAMQGEGAAKLNPPTPP